VGVVKGAEVLVVGKPLKNWVGFVVVVVEAYLVGVLVVVVVVVVQ